MVTYHLCKQTRVYDGEPYRGPSSNYIPMSFDLFSEALDARDKLQNRNPVGWNIFNADTGELVNGHIFIGE